MQATAPDRSFAHEHTRRAAEVVALGRRRGPGAVLWRACRPPQWLKNTLVVIAPAAAGALTRPGVPVRLMGAFAAFCLVSSATYLINDVRDRESDRRHPRKRMRPVAAGELSPRGAIRIAVVLAGLGLALAGAVRVELALVAVGYLVLTTTYSVWLRHVVVADIVVVALGFVLRATAGGAAAGVHVSRAFLIVTSACALFVVAGKRYAELTRMRGQRLQTRATLRRYSAVALRRMLLAAALLGCAAYAQWAVARPEYGPWFELSMIPFAASFARYWARLRGGAGEAPEEVLLRDPALLGLGLVWTVLFLGGVYGPR